MLAGSAAVAEPTTPEVRPTYRSIAEMLLARVAATPDLEAYRYPVGDDAWQSLTWQQALDRVCAIACGLHALGLRPEQRVGILSSTRLEWILADLAVLCAGGATTTVYPSNTGDECTYMLSDAGCVALFAEDAGQVDKIRGQRSRLPALTRVISFDGVSDGDWVLSLDALERSGRDWQAVHPGAFEAVVRAIEPGRLATLIYTSGTTGRPKAVRLAHASWTYEAEAIVRAGFLRPDDLQYLWLPLSHAFGRVMEVGQIQVGFATAVDGRIARLLDNLAVVRPTFMAAPPRIFEKLYNRIVGGRQSGLQHAIVRRAIEVGLATSALRQRGEQPHGWLSLEHRIADRLVFSRLRARFGGRIRFFVSGSAPLSREIAELFHAAGLLILEGYGLTETSAASFVNRPEAFRFGTVGRAMPGTQVRLDPSDHEILIKSPGVMRGYHNLPDETRETLTEDGWLRTGDIGELDADGFLKITDRKKDLIKTSGGKYVAPQRLETRFKALCPYVSQILVHGDRRNYCTALIALDEDALRAWAQERGRGELPYAELVALPEVEQLIAEYVDKLNAGLASYETIKQFRILPRDLSVEDGELTASLKVKRKAVETKYAPLLDGMYEAATAPP